MTTKINFSKLSLQDALDLAILIEAEAEERYKEFNQMLGNRYEGDAASFFTLMAGNEAKHGQQLADRRAKLFGKTPSKISPDMIDSVEAPDYDKPRSFMSTRHAFEVALESEKKAEAFFNSALNVISDPKVKELFAELRDEEIEHQNLLLEQMKKVPNDMDPDVDPDDIDTPQN